MKGKKEIIDFKPDDLNLLYAASLEFGENWRRPLLQWAQELFSKEDEKFHGTIAEYIGAIRTKIKTTLLISMK